MPTKHHSPATGAAADTHDAIGPTDGRAGVSSRVEGGSASDLAAVDFDDDELYSGTGHNTRRGGTDRATGGDSGRLGPPSEQLSRSNEPRERRN